MIRVSVGLVSLNVITLSSKQRDIFRTLTDFTECFFYRFTVLFYSGVFYSVLLFLSFKLALDSVLH